MTEASLPFDGGWGGPCDLFALRPQLAHANSCSVCEAHSRMYPQYELGEPQDRMLIISGK
jgi:hypothetical protein